MNIKQVRKHNGRRVWLAVAAVLVIFSAVYTGYSVSTGVAEIERHR